MVVSPVSSPSSQCRPGQNRHGLLDATRILYLLDREWAVQDALIRLWIGAVCTPRPLKSRCPMAGLVAHARSCKHLWATLFPWTALSLALQSPIRATQRHGRYA